MLAEYTEYVVAVCGPVALLVVHVCIIGVCVAHSDDDHQHKDTK